MAKYLDLDLNFTAHPVTGDVPVLTDDAAISRAIVNLVLLQHYESPFQPDKGTNIYGYVFENYPEFMRLDVERDIEQSIRLYEPRAKLESVEVEFLEDDNKANLYIVFSVIDRLEPVRVRVFLQRVR